MEDSQSATQSGCAYSREAPETRQGEYQVRITSGPLRGLVGAAIARRSGNRLLVAAPECGSGVFVQIDPCLVRMVDSAIPEQTTS